MVLVAVGILRALSCLLTGPGQNTCGRHDGSFPRADPHKPGCYPLFDGRPERGNGVSCREVRTSSGQVGLGQGKQAKEARRKKKKKRQAAAGKAEASSSIWKAAIPEAASSFVAAAGGPGAV